MKIARMLAPVHALGPGRRVALWTQGCRRRCRGCISPELRPPGREEVPEPLLASIIRETADREDCGGLTVSGGDPFDQPEALLRLLRLLRDRFDDILVYTGWTMKEIRSGACGREGILCLEEIDVLIDGPYEEERNFPDCVLRGSDNQLIQFLSPGHREQYETYMQNGRFLESFAHTDTMIVVGIPDRGYRDG